MWGFFYVGDSPSFCNLGPIIQGVPEKSVFYKFSALTDCFGNHSWLQHKTTFMCFCQPHTGPFWGLPRMLKTHFFLRHPYLLFLGYAVKKRKWKLGCSSATLEMSVLWKNPASADPKANRLPGRKVVGHWTFIREVATPVPAVYRTPSHPMLLEQFRQSNMSKLKYGWLIS